MEPDDLVKLNAIANQAVREQRLFTKEELTALIAIVCPIEEPEPLESEEPDYEY